MKKIIILGSSGFIGKNLTEKLKKNNTLLFGTYFQSKPKKK